ncbi:ABC transporter permease [Marinobacterium aestuariivivens]|uniref:ABC transporter permease n=1 Tax=Marinobacterium aestuariivivens TaxID=1698799 RepID=A0ABW1ZYH7_9GAMM
MPVAARSAGLLLLPALLLTLCVGMDWFEPWFALIETDSRTLIYGRDSFLALLLSHCTLVLLSSALAALVGIAMGILVTRPSGRDFLPFVSQLASVGQTFPPVAVLALAVPLLGFGTLPTLVALFLYGLLPIVRNCIAGLDGISASVREAARGMGMSPLQILRQVELPLAAAVILAGVRTSVTLNIATAALGSTVGARTLGDPIIAGLINGNVAYVLQGAILVGLLALATDQLFDALQRRLDVRR